MGDLDIDPELRSLVTSLYTLLPIEIVTTILDYAEIWVREFSTTLPPQLPPLVVAARPLGAMSDALLLSSRPLSRRDILKLRRVTISFTSKDQGWSSYPKFHGTYEDSWTWFNVALLSPAEIEARSAQASLHNQLACEFTPRTYRLQHNRHAGKAMESYIFHLDKSQGHSLYDDLCENDSFALMAYAMFPGWENHVKSASLQLWKADFHGLPRSLV